jgi:hypothetical protein
MSQERENIRKLWPTLYVFAIVAVAVILWGYVTPKGCWINGEVSSSDSRSKSTVDTITGGFTSGIVIADVPDVGDTFFDDQPHGDLERTIEEQELDEDVQMEHFYDEDPGEDPIIHEAFDDGPDQVGEAEISLLRDDDPGELIQ